MAAKKEAPYQAFRKTIAKTVTVDGLDIFVSYPSQGRLFTSLTKLQETERPRPFRKGELMFVDAKVTPVPREYRQTAAQARRAFDDFMRVMALATTDEMLQWIAGLAPRKKDGNLVANKNLFVCRLEGKFGYERNLNGRKRFDSTYTLIAKTGKENDISILVKREGAFSFHKAVVYLYAYQVLEMHAGLLEKYGLRPVRRIEHVVGDIHVGEKLRPVLKKACDALQTRETYGHACSPVRLVFAGGEEAIRAVLATMIREYCTASDMPEEGERFAKEIANGRGATALYDIADAIAETCFDLAPLFSAHSEVFTYADADCLRLKRSGNTCFLALSFAVSMELFEGELAYFFEQLPEGEYAFAGARWYEDEMGYVYLNLGNQVDGGPYQCGPNADIGKLMMPDFCGCYLSELDREELTSGKTAQSQAVKRLLSMIPTRTYTV